METKKKDKRDCPKCGARMEMKGSTCSCSDEDAKVLTVFQCTECKNVEVLYV